MIVVRERNTVRGRDADRQPGRHHAARHPGSARSGPDRVRRYAAYAKASGPSRHREAASELPRTQRAGASRGIAGRARRRQEHRAGVRRRDTADRRSRVPPGGAGARARDRGLPDTRAIGSVDSVERVRTADRCLFLWRLSTRKENPAQENAGRGEGLSSDSRVLRSAAPDPGNPDRYRGSPGAAAYRRSGAS